MKENFESSKPDPSKTLFLEQNLVLEEQGAKDMPSIHKGANGQRVVYKDKKTGEEFFLVNSNPELQRLIIYVVKGIINVADIVKYNGKYFSHQQKLEDVAESNPFYLEEVSADKFILKYVFGDYDHVYYESDDSRLQDFLKQRKISLDVMQANNTEHRNIVVNDKINKHYFFDFDQSGSSGLGFGEGIHSLQIQEEKIINDFKNMIISVFEKGDFDLKTIEILNDKISTLIKNVFSPNQFERFKKMIDRSQTELKEKAFDFYRFKSKDKEGKIRELFDDLSRRCQAISDVVSEILVLNR